MFHSDKQKTWLEGIVDRNMVIRSPRASAMPPASAPPSHLLDEVGDAVSTEIIPL